MADELGLPSDAAGIAVAKIEGGPAARFMKKGDVILDINGRKIDSVETLGAVLAEEADAWRIALKRGSRVLKLAIGG